MSRVDELLAEAEATVGREVTAPVVLARVASVMRSAGVSFEPSAEVELQREAS